MRDLDEMKLLISLAQIDGIVAPRERNFIINIGHANNIAAEQIEPLFDKRHSLAIPENLSQDQKFSYLFNLVRLMKIDERMYKEELLFCTKIASGLGYEKEAMVELLLHVKSGGLPDEEMGDLKLKIQKYLKAPQS